jgi:exopolyphosphatase/guanosine-5'-triphosphate,3'-diphosphate pyrophosphatase
VERRLAVIDLGSNSFRLVVFTHTDDWWKRTDEIYEPVRVGEHQEPGGPLRDAPMERALEAIDMFAHFCRASGIDRVRPLATSAIREASNRQAFVQEVRERSGLEIEVLPREEEARLGYLAAVNSTTLSDGVALDIGGGSMQLTRVGGRRALDARSWRLGAVVATERFLPTDRVKPKQLKALREHVREELRQAHWLGHTRARLAGVGGAVRNLAATVMLAEELPDVGIQGFCIRRSALDDLVDELASRTPRERRKVPGIKPERADVILAGAVVIQTVMEVGGFKALEATEAGLREGAFFDELYADEPGHLVPDVRAAAVRNLAAQYHPEERHTEHVARLALEIWDALADAGVHPGDAEERELLWAAAILHDIGTAIDYDDHHKHSRYLILNAGLPGFSPRETALIGQMARYHRKGEPGLREFAPLGRKGDEELLARCASALRLAEQLERPRDQAVRHADVVVDGDRVELRLRGERDLTVGVWAAQRQSDLFERAFARGLTVVG